MPTGFSTNNQGGPRPPTTPTGSSAWEYNETKNKLFNLPNNEISRFLIFSYATAARQEEAIRAKVEGIKIFDDPAKMHILLPIAKIRISHAEKTLVLTPNQNIFEKFLFDTIVKQKESWTNNPSKPKDPKKPEDEQTLFFNHVTYKFNTKKNYARRWAVKYLHCNHHFLRHCRLTHFAKVFDFNEYELITVAGWTDIKPATSYIKMKTKDIERRMQLYKPKKQDTEE